MFALFVSCLGHDIDHRGTNNQYQVASVSTCMVTWFFQTILYIRKFSDALILSDFFNVMKLRKILLWYWKVSDRRIWLTKFNLDLLKIKISAVYFIVRTDKIFKIGPNDLHVQKDVKIFVKDLEIGEKVLLVITFTKDTYCKMFLMYSNF